MCSGRLALVRGSCSCRLQFDWGIFGSDNMIERLIQFRLVPGSAASVQFKSPVMVYLPYCQYQLYSIQGSPSLAGSPLPVT